MLAPQYRQGRKTLAEFDAPEVSLATLFEASPADSPPSPKVTVKRRRLTVPPSMAPVPADVNSAPSAPRIYRLAPATATMGHLGPTPGLKADHLTDQRVAVPKVDQPVAAQKKHRRRSAPTRSPGVVNHVVFSRPAKVDAPLELSPSDEAVELDTRVLRAALAQLDAALARVARAQEAFRALDRLLTRLGVGDNASRPRRAKRAADKATAL